MPLFFVETMSEAFAMIAKASLIFSTKIISVFGYKVTYLYRTLNKLTF